MFDFVLKEFYSDKTLEYCCDLISKGKEVRMSFDNEDIGILHT